MEHLHPRTDTGYRLNIAEKLEIAHQLARTDVDGHRHSREQKSVVCMGGVVL
jgi:hypothetical protein